MATKRYRRSNKSKELTYEDIKGLDFNSLTPEELEQYGFGSWLKKNAAPIGTVVGAGAGMLLGPAGSIAGASLGASLGGSVGGAISADAAQDEALKAQNAQSAQLQQQQGLNIANQNLQQEMANKPLYGAVMKRGGKIKKMEEGGGNTPKDSTKYYLNTYKGEREITPEEVNDYERYLELNNRLRDVYQKTYKTRISNLNKKGINSPDSYAEHIKNMSDDILPSMKYTDLYKGAKFTDDEIAFYEPTRNKYFGGDYLSGTNESKDKNVTDLDYAGRQLFADLSLGIKKIPVKVPTEYKPSTPYSYEPLRGYPNMQIGYTMDETSGKRTPSVFRNDAGQEVPIDPKKGLQPERYPEFTKDFQYAQPKKPLSETTFKNGGEITKKEKKYDDTTIEFGLLHPNATVANTQKLSYNIPGEGLGKFIKGASYITPLIDIISDIKSERTLKGEDLTKYRKVKRQELNRIKNPDMQQLQDYVNSQTNSGYLKYGGTLNYGGQLHEGPDGGVPVDEMGNPNQVNPVALVEKGEVSYNTPDGGTYIYSDTLKHDRDKTFAKKAKDVQRRYKFRMKDGVINDPFAKKSYDNEMLGLMDNQEELRDFQNMQKESLRIKKYGGNLPTYPEPNESNGFDMFLPRPITAANWMLDTTPIPPMVTPQTSTAYEDLNAMLDADNNSFKKTLELRNKYPEVANWKAPKVNPGSTQQMRKDLGITTNNNNVNSPELYQGMNWAETSLAAAGPILGGTLGLILNKRRKTPTKLRLSRMTPQQISLERERRAARESANLATANISRGIRNAAPTSGSYMSNMVAGITDVDRNLSDTIGKSFTKEELQNAQFRQQADAANLDINMQEQMYNTQLQNQFDNSKEAARNAYINQIAGGVTGALSQKFQSEQNADYLGGLNPDMQLMVEGKGINRKRRWTPRPESIRNNNVTLYNSLVANGKPIPKWLQDSINGY